LMVVMVREYMRLLILKCSARKRTDNATLPALERYDGPLWKVLRAFLREYPTARTELDIYALSAQYGLIPASSSIENYDLLMTPAQAVTIQPHATHMFTTLMQREYQAICLALSQRYLAALGDWHTKLDPDRVRRVTITDGPEGMKLHQLRQWLIGATSTIGLPPKQSLIADEHPRGTATIGGVTLSLSANAVLEQARQGLYSDPKGARKFRDWYVMIDETPVGSKWLVSMLTGLSPSQFQAEAARRFLLQLGISIFRAESAR
jgi:hypothetical protein